MLTHNARALFYPDAFEKQHLRLTTLLVTFDKQIKNANKAGPRQEYVKLLVQEVKRSRELSSPSEHAIRRFIFKHHSELFKQLDGGQVAALRVRARGQVSQRIETLADSREHVLAHFSTLRRRQEEAKRNGLVNHVSSVRFGDREFQRFAELWPRYSKSDTPTLQPPSAVPAPALMRLMEDMVSKQNGPQRQVPNWLSAMVTHRKDFEGRAFYSDSVHPNGELVYKMLLAIHQPMLVMFLECSRAPPRTRRPLYSLGPGDYGDYLSYQTYEYTALRFVDASRVPWTNMLDMWILPETHFRNNELHVVGEPVHSRIITRYHNNTHARVSDNSSSRTRSDGKMHKDTLLLFQQEFPCLTLEQILELMQTKLSTGSGASSGGSHNPGPSSGSSSAPPVAFDLAEDVVARVDSQLRDLRSELDANDEAFKRFRMRALGGEWSVKQFKKTVNDMGCYARDKSVRAWCESDRFSAAMSFAIDKYGGLHNSRMLAEDVTRKGNYYYQAWLDADCPDTFNFEDLKSGYRSTPAYNNWWEDLLLTSASFKAAVAIAEMCPLALAA